MNTVPFYLPVFDAAKTGTPDEHWRQAACACPDWRPAPGSLLVVAPHPDDETLGAGGLIHTMSRSGCSITVLSVTDGEAAYPDWPDLRAVRMRELDDALRLLAGNSIQVRRLHLADGGVRQARTVLRDVLLETMLAADIVVAPYEQDGHPDHEIVGEVCRELADQLGLPLVRYPVWAWHHGSIELLAQRSWVRFSLTSEAARSKALALQCFRSQLEPLGRDAIVPAHVLPYFQRDFEMFLL